MNNRRRPATVPGGAVRAFARDTRAAAGIELAIGAVVLVSVAALCFDLYSRVEAVTTAARIAATMTDYVSRGPDTDGGTLDGAALKALGAFLHEREFGAAAHLVFVISALHKPAGTSTPAVKVLWSDDTLRFGEETVTAALAADCARLVAESGGTTTAKLPADFAMDAGEVAVVVELCARPSGAGSLTGRFDSGDIYRHHVLPARAPEKALPAPVHARRGGAPGAVARA